MQRRLLAGMGAALALSLTITGCTAAHYKASADREVYSIVKQKTGLVPGMAKGFTIDPSPKAEQRVCPPTIEEKSAAPAQKQGPAGPTVVLSLAKALEIAAYNSRNYQSQKESVYLSALTLTSQRFRFSPQFSGTGSGQVADAGMGNADSISGNTAFGFNWLLKTGAAISTELSTDFSRTINGHPVEASSSLFNLTITQPILQGAGVAVTAPLTQAERNVVYQIRSFVQFRRQFFVQVLSDYYRVLENLKVLANQKENYKGLLFARDRAQALSEANQLASFQVDQAQQDLLQAEDSVLRAEQSYESSLDSFRIELGLPPETDLELDPAELDRLTAEKAEALPFELDNAIEMALLNRLDLITANDQVVDATRNVAVAANGLLPGLNLSAGLSSATAGTNQPLNFTSDLTNSNAGFSIDLGLNRLNQRNAYRSSLVSLDQSKRSQCQVRDGVVEDVRGTWRQFQRTNSSYKIALARVDLARRRVESTEMLLEAGRAIMRDLLDAQSALLSAQNDLAAAIVDYRLARLDLAVNMDILYVSETGQLKESFDEYFRPQSQ